MEAESMGWEARQGSGRATGTGAHRYLGGLSGVKMWAGDRGSQK